MGQIIVVEGASDGIGKTTQYKLLQEHLKADGTKIITHHFPTYYAYQGKSVEKYLAGDYGNPSDLSPYFINSLYAHDRAVTWKTKLEKHYLAGKTLLFDRYTTSSLIYQTALIEGVTQKKAFLDYVSDFEYNKLSIGRPDIVIFLYAPLKLVNAMRTKRRANDGITNDIHERNLDYLRQVYDNAMFVADYLGWEKINCATKSGDAILKPETIHRDIYQRIRQLKTSV